MIRVNVFFQAQEGKYSEALEAAIALTAASQKDAGVISYDCFESATRGDVFMICETWESEQALEAHQATVHYKEYVSTIEACGAVKAEKFTF